MFCSIIVVNYTQTPAITKAVEKELVQEICISPEPLLQYQQENQEFYNLSLTYAVTLSNYRALYLNMSRQVTIHAVFINRMQRTWFMK